MAQDYTGNFFTVEDEQGNEVVYTILTRIEPDDTDSSYIVCYNSTEEEQTGERIYEAYEVYPSEDGEGEDLYEIGTQEEIDQINEVIATIEALSGEGKL